MHKKTQTKQILKIESDEFGDGEHNEASVLQCEVIWILVVCFNDVIPIRFHKLIQLVLSVVRRRPPIGGC